MRGASARKNTENRRKSDPKRPKSSKRATVSKIAFSGLRHPPAHPRGGPIRPNCVNSAAPRKSTFFEVILGAINRLEMHQNAILRVTCAALFFDAVSEGLLGTKCSQNDVKIVPETRPEAEVVILALFCTPTMRNLRKWGPGGTEIVRKTTKKQVPAPNVFGTRFWSDFVLILDSENGRKRSQKPARTPSKKSRKKVDFRASQGPPQSFDPESPGYFSSWDFCTLEHQ